MTNSIREIADSDFLLVIGSNTTETHPIISLQMKKAVRNGATLAVADPRQTEIADLADFHLQLQAGSDLALLNGLANVILTEGLWNQEFVNTRTEGFAEFKATVEQYTPEKVAAVTGVPADTIREVARRYATAANGAIFYTMGVTQKTTGTHNVMAVANLALLTGQIGRPSTGINPLRGQNNVQGACDMGALPNVLTGYQQVADPAVREKFSQAWNTPLPEKVGLTVGEMLDAAHHGEIKAMLIMGENPLVSDPDTRHVQEALSHLDFLVVQDIFLTETAQLADVVLPGASFAEKDGTFSNTERRVQRVRQAIEPVGNCRPDWQIIADLGTAMGYRMHYHSAEEIMREIALLTPSYGGISYARLEQDGLQWPCPNEKHNGTPYLHAEKFTRGLGKFHAVEYQPPAEVPDAEYPLVLSTGRRLFHYHTGTMTRRAAGLQEIYPADYLEINPVDAKSLGLADQERVRLSSRRGEIEMPVKITDRVRPGLVFTSFHFFETLINKLTNPARDPIAKIPELKVCAVRIEKLA